MVQQKTSNRTSFRKDCWGNRNQLVIVWTLGGFTCEKEKTLLNLTKIVYGWISNRLSSRIPFIVGKGGLPAVCSGGGGGVLQFCWKHTMKGAWCRYPVPKARWSFQWNGGMVIEIKLLGETCITHSIHVWHIYKNVWLIQMYIYIWEM